MSSDNAAPILSREEIGELKMFITAHRALAGTRVNDILYSHEAQREEIQCLTESRDAISALFPDDALHKHPETGVSLLDDVRDVIAERDATQSERDGLLRHLKREIAATTAADELQTAELSALRAELEAVKAERDRQYEFNAGQIAKYAALEVEHEKARVRLEEATGALAYYAGLGACACTKDCECGHCKARKVVAAISQTAQPEEKREA